MSLSLNFRSFASGRSVCFWEDIWNGRLLQLDFPQLHSFARDPKISVKAFMSRSSEENFLLPLSLTASQQLDTLLNLLSGIQHVDNEDDRWTYLIGC